MSFTILGIRHVTAIYSIYYPEPDGVLFESATDHAGFAIDEPSKQPGIKLV